MGRYPCNHEGLEMLADTDRYLRLTVVNTLAALARRTPATAFGLRASAPRSEYRLQLFTRAMGAKDFLNTAVDSQRYSVRAQRRVYNHSTELIEVCGFSRTSHSRHVSQLQ